MKKADFVRGAKGFIIRADHKSDATPENIRILKITLCGDIKDKLFGIDFFGNIYEVNAGDVFYSFEAAKKYALRFLSKMYRKLETAKEV